MVTRKQTGFSLIEVMISVLVLALGVIGATGMQATALRTTQQSTFQTAAVELATEIAEKMRANSTQMQLAVNPYVNVDFTAGTSLSQSPQCYGNTHCNSDELARFDIYEWQTRITEKLPGGRAVICRDGSSWSTDAHALKWECAAGASSGSFVVKVGWQAKNPDGSFARNGSNQFPPQVAISVEPYSR